MAGRPKQLGFRLLLRLLVLAAWTLLIAGMFIDFRVKPGTRDLPWRNSRATALIGLWITSGVFGYIGLKAVALTAWAWERARRAAAKAHPDKPPVESMERR